jgi:thioredoxin reductase (NADPH)
MSTDSGKNMGLYDTVIIGGGPAGLTAGIYAARARMKTLLLEKMMVGGQAATTETIENYPGFPEGIAGPELTERMREQAEKFGVDFADGEVNEVKEAMFENGKGFLLVAEGGEYRALTLIVATGAQASSLKIPGEKKFTGKGVSYCATCDGPFFRDQDIVVAGGGDTAVEEALFLTKFAKKVYLVHRRDRLRATKILQDRALANPKIELVWDSVLTEIAGEISVEKVRLKNVKTGEETELAVRGVFVFVGIVPNTEFLQELVEMNSTGYIVTDDNMQTTAQGVFACGDARRKLLRQVVTACGEGATAAFSAQHYVEELKGIAYK